MVCLSGVSLLSSRSVTRLRESCYGELSVGIMSTDDPAAVSQVFGYSGLVGQHGRQQF